MYTFPDESKESPRTATLPAIRAAHVIAPADVYLRMNALETSPAEKERVAPVVPLAFDAENALV
jgi:hypothetical protein